MEILLKEKVALITGCDQGIGLAICKEFVSQGATVYANGLKETPIVKILTCKKNS